MAQIVIKTGWNGLVVKTRITIVFHAAHAATLVRLRAPERVIGDNQIEQSVVVVIEPGGADAHRTCGLPAYSRLRSHIAEGSVSLVVIEGVSSSAANKKIHIPIVVVIAGGDAKIVVELLPEKSSLFRYVL